MGGTESIRNKKVEEQSKIDYKGERKSLGFSIVETTQKKVVTMEDERTGKTKGKRFAVASYDDIRRKKREAV